jgi:hypothetical protein
MLSSDGLILAGYVTPNNYEVFCGGEGTSSVTFEATVAA